MIKYICDRCKQEVVNTPFEIYIKRDSHNEVDREDLTYELCDECMHKLIHNFMGTEEKGDKNETKDK